MRSLVTGAGGFIGGHLAKALLARGDEVQCADRKPLGEWKQVHFGALNMSELELGNDRNAAAAVAGCDVVYHLAAEAGGMGFISTHKADCTLSILADAHVLQAARNEKVSRIWYASSACIYPLSLQETADAPDLAEWMAYDPKPEPEEAYGWEKLYAERMYLAHAEDYGMQVRIGRYQSVYGPDGVYKGGREKAPTAISRKVAMAKLKGEHDIPIWGDGSAIRTFTYVDDAVEATLAITASDYGQPLNVGTHEVLSIAQLVEVIGDIAGWEVRPYTEPGPVGVPGRRGCDTSLTLEKTGWKSRVTVREGLERTYAWVYAQLKAELGE